MMTDKKSRPFVVCHMLCSIDGKIEGNFMSAPESASCIKNTVISEAHSGARRSCMGRGQRRNLSRREE